MTVAISNGQVCKRKPLTTNPKCNCEPCLIIRRRLMKQRRVYGAQGIAPPREQAWAVIDQWIALGYTQIAAGSACGVDARTAWRWITSRRDGYPMRLGRGACQAILTAGRPTEGSMSPVIACRMVRALARIGWSTYELDRQTQGAVPWHVFQGVRSGKMKHLAVGHHFAIVDVYYRLWMTPGPSAKSRVIGAKKRWAAPLAWDNIEDITERNPRDLSDRDMTSVDQDSIEARLDGDKTVPLTKAERAELVRQATKLGWGVTRIETTTGIRPSRYIEEDA